jgi:hypothetical protein
MLRLPGECERLVEVLALRRVEVRDVVVGARVLGTQSDGALVRADSVRSVALLLVGVAKREVRVRGVRIQACGGAERVDSGAENRRS